MSQRPIRKRSRSSIARSFLRGELLPENSNDADTVGTISQTQPNDFLDPSSAIPPARIARNADGSGTAVSQGSYDSRNPGHQEDLVAPPGIQTEKASIEESVRTFRIFEALRNGDRGAVSDAVRKTSKDKLLGTTLLHLAVQCAEPDVVEYVLSCSKSAGLNARDREGNTPLHLAAHLGRVEIVKRLLREPEVDESIRNRQKKMPVDVARTAEISQALQLARSLYIEDVVHRVQGAIAQANYDKLEELLTDARVERVLDANYQPLVSDPETMQTGGTLLHQGARKKDAALIQALLMHGADPFRRDRHGRLPQDVTKDENTRTILKKSPAAAVAQRGIQEKAILCNSPNPQGLVQGHTDLEKQSREIKGYLKKWTNYTGGYKLRWFVLEDGVLSYYKHQGEPIHPFLVAFFNYRRLF